MSAAALRHVRLIAVATGYELRKATAFRVGFLLKEVFEGLPRPMVMSLVYLAIYRARGEESIEGFAFSDMVAYLILAALLVKMIPHEWLLDLADQIFEGRVTKLLVMPFPYFSLVLARWLQHLAVQATVVVLLWIGGTLLLPGWWPKPSSALALVEASVLVLVGTYCFLLTYFILNAAAFWFEVVWTLLIMMRFITGFVGGLIVPVSIMPGPLREAFSWTFPYWTLSAPVEILLGRLGTEAFLEGLGVLVASALLLQGAAHSIWRRGLARHQGVGM